MVHTRKIAATADSVIITQSYMRCDNKNKNDRQAGRQAGRQANA